MNFTLDKQARMILIDEKALIHTYAHTIGIRGCKNHFFLRIIIDHGSQ
jgi:hypothetical protein